MGDYQSAAKHYVMALVTAIMVVFLVSGCVARKGESTGSMAGAPQESPEVKAENVSPRAVENISIKSGPDQLEVWIRGNRNLEFTSIKQAFPFGISVYLPDTILGSDFMPPSHSDGRVSRIKADYADDNRTTVKIEMLLTKDLPYVVKEEGDRLGVILKGETKTPASTQAQASMSSVSGNDTPDALVTPAVQKDLVISDAPADLTDIEFDTMSSGDSDIKIKTSHPVRYETRQAGEDTLHLILYNTKIPVHHQRPLLTRYFNSAVERVDPRPYPGKEENTRIDIKIREQVPFRVVQTQAGIQMSFEPSSVRPPEFDKAKVSLDGNTVEPEVSAEGSGAKRSAGAVSQRRQQGPEEKMFVEDIDTLTGGHDRQYIGEKIKLDFYDTDIKNVFRILKSVSGLNFAIDSDVEGRVTLSLEQPVPWDQVMDLVLKMNQLGKKREGNVYRIATLTTIAREEDELQAAIAERKESMEQKKSLEPMFTEYIPISYTSAIALIDHIIPIMSPSDGDDAVEVKTSRSSFRLRGSITVDDRTNLIVMTDTQEKIEKAYEIINELDKPTPQIMIEAKVVEVTKEFSRSFGMNWTLSNAEEVTSGFIDDFGVAVNEGTTGGIAGSFSFFRLFGSSVTALNAQLAASEEQGDVRIVSSPKIMTLDNKKAMIKQGQEYAYLERDDSGGSSVKFKDIDLLLEVTPHVTPDNRISMTVRLTKNDVASLTSTGVPILNTNEAETELLVDHQDTIVIGGVVKSSVRDNSDGVPFLSGIPVLNHLFSVQTKEDNRDELLIFLTPSIVQLEQKRRRATDRSPVKDTI